METLTQDAFPEIGQTVDFTLSSGDQWQDINVPIPVDGTLAIIRLFLPANASSLEIESIQFENQSSEIKAWQFSDQNTLSSDR